MIRSRVTFATMLAAATQAATWSPFHTASPGTASPGTGNPSVSTYCGTTDSEASARRIPARLHTCRPRPSTSPGSITTTDHARAARHDLRVQPLPGGGGEQLRVGQPVDLPALARREHHGADHQRPGTRAPARLVGAGHQLEAAPLQRPLQGVHTTLAVHDRARRRKHHITPRRRSRTGRSGG